MSKRGQIARLPWLMLDRPAAGQLPAPGAAIRRLSHQPLQSREGEARHEIEPEIPGQCDQCDTPE